MAKSKEVVAKVKLQCPGGQATAAPPVGPALSPHGVNIGQFIQEFNSKTADAQGIITPCIVTVYGDRRFEITLKSPPASVLLKQAAGVAAGAATPGKEMVGTVTRAQVREIAQKKIKDLNADNVDHAMRIIEGTARSIGITVTD
ncbi:MAG TPA: 50S ribosomal protein L11 [Candidatus Brocadiia bacterium]|nr:50S ribosomal protein L11 [Candidatus Brocadiia bacterium]